MLQRSIWLALIVLVALARVTEAAEFTINPLQVYLERTNRASEIIVRNDDSAPLRMQVQAMSWRQDANGQDQYEAADDLLYFPRAMEIAPGDSRVIRVGVKAAPVTREDAYRVFIEELPPATPVSAQPASSGTVPAGTTKTIPVGTTGQVVVLSSLPNAAALTTAVQNEVHAATIQTQTTISATLNSIPVLNAISLANSIRAQMNGGG